MSTRVSLNEASKNFSELIEQAGRGEEIIITRNGEDVAKIVATSAARPNPTEALQKIEAFRKLRERNILNPPWAKERLTIKDLTTEGRKY